MREEQSSDDPNKQKLSWGVPFNKKGTFKFMSLAEVEDKSGISINALVGGNASRDFLEENQVVIVDASLVSGLVDVTAEWARENHFKDLKARAIASLTENLPSSPSVEPK